MSNEYDDWNGAGIVTESKIFYAPGKEADDTVYEAFEEYLPPKSSSAIRHFFVGRVATTSRKRPKAEVVKLFGNVAWNRQVLSELERLEFTKVDSDSDHLISDEEVDLTVGDWRSAGRMEVFRKLDGPGKPAAKIPFTHESTGESISAFWCWPE